MLLNVARAACERLPLPREHKFEAADVMAIRAMDSMALSRGRSDDSRLLAFRKPAQNIFLFIKLFIKILFFSLFFH